MAKIMEITPEEFYSFEKDYFINDNTLKQFLEKLKNRIYQFKRIKLEIDNNNLGVYKYFLLNFIKIGEIILRIDPQIYAYPGNRILYIEIFDTSILPLIEKDLNEFAVSTPDIDTVCIIR